MPHFLTEFSLFPSDIWDINKVHWWDMSQDQFCKSRTYKFQSCPVPWEQKSTWTNPSIENGKRKWGFQDIWCLCSLCGRAGSSLVTKMSPCPGNNHLFQNVQSWAREPLIKQHPLTFTTAKPCKLFIVREEQHCTTRSQTHTEFSLQLPHFWWSCAKSAVIPSSIYLYTKPWIDPVFK